MARRPASNFAGIDVDLNDMPDTVQTLAVVALFADGPTTIRNVANLRVKETDRIAALNTELTKLSGRRSRSSTTGFALRHRRASHPRRSTPTTITVWR